MQVLAVIQKFYITTWIVLIFTVIYAIALYYRLTTTSASSLFSSDGVKKPARFPPWISPCPTYWMQNADGTCTKRFNNGRNSCDASAISASGALSYTEGSQTVDFQRATWVDKCKWTSQCGVAWEGVSDKPCVGSSFEGY